MKLISSTSTNDYPPSREILDKLVEIYGRSLKECSPSPIFIFTFSFSHITTAISPLRSIGLLCVQLSIVSIFC